MNFKDMLNKMSQLSEATKETTTGRVHKAEPGGYGRKFDTDEEGDEKKADKPAVKRGRGRPKKGADDSGEVKKYDNAKSLQSFMIGNVPKKSKDLEKLPKKKHSLKEYFEDLDTKLVNEMTAQQPIPVVGKQGSTQQTGAGFIHIDDTSPAGQAMSKALGDLAKQKKAQIVMPTQTTPSPNTGMNPAAKPGQQQNPNATPSPNTGMNPAAKPGQQQVSEKFGTDVKINPAEKGKYAGKSKAELLKAYHALKKSGPHKKGSDEFGRMRELAFAIRAKSDWGKVQEADQPPHDSMASPLTLEGKGSKPDFIDLDKDGNKKESMKKAAQDKKKVKEGMDHRLKAARHAGKAHALAKEGYNCRYDDMEEAKHYHEGYKEGLDECYGQMPIVGLVQDSTMPAATVPGMASQEMKQPAMEDDVEEGNAFTAALAKTPKGEKFSVGGKTFTDRSNYNAKVDESPFAFEAWDRELNALLESKQDVSEGMSVSISKGQQGSPDSVTVSAQDGEAEQLLGLIKQAGLGLFGGEEHSGYGAPQGEAPQHGGIEVVDDHDGMMALMKKLTGGEPGNADYADEEGEREETCEVCGESSCGCDEGQEMVDEVESEDQMTYQVAEDNPPDSGEAEEATEIADTAQANASGAAYNPSNDVDEGAGGPEASEEPVQPMVSEESDEEEDDHAEKAGKEVAKDIEHDEGHKGKDDDKAEKAGEKVTKDIEYDDKKDKKEKVDEWANQTGKGPGKGTDASFEADIDFMMNVISGGLNKRKQTGQTTIPVVASQLNRQVSHNTVGINESEDPVAEWKKLAGI